MACALLCAAAVVRAVDPSAVDPPAVDLSLLAPVPRPDVSGMDGAVQEQLAAVRGALEARLDALQPEATDLAAAFGQLGRIYLAYDLAEAAAVAFRNAEMLVPADARWPYYRGVIDERAGRFEAAAEHFGRALTLRPEDVPTLIHLGQLALARRRYEEAESWLQQVLRHDPDAAAAHAGLGEVAHWRGEPARAIEHFEIALRIQPEASALRYQLALAHRELGDLEAARAEIARRGETKVRFADPVVDALRHLTTGYGSAMAQGGQAFDGGDFAAAVAAYRRAVEAAPDNLTARQALASALTRNGQLEEALAVYRAVLAQDAEDAVVRYNLGTVLMSLERHAEAAHFFREALSRDPQLLDAHFNLAVVHEALGEPAAAESHYAAVLQIEPEDADARLRRARVLQQLDRPQQAAAELEIMLAADPYNADALLGLGSVLVGLGDRQAAMARYRAALALDLDAAREGTARFLLGDLLTAEGQVQAALDQLEKAAALQPRAVDVHLALARLLGRSGRFREAAERFAAVLTFAPQHEEAHFGRATALTLGAHYAQARAALEDSRAALPESVPLDHALARLLATCPDAAVRDGARALTLAREVFAKQQSFEHGETVAMALAELGRFDEAVAWQQRLIREATSAARHDLLPRLGDRLAHYERREPVRAPWRAPGASASESE